ncbi:selenoneine biosynthesis selenosugar synthase SenB [Actinopolymorpha rutila]|uniref:Putative glycosyltransferase (TIGR04348 family) n=1 Tax=Actinopolymorpha rutila TaxID=446787 RepID=A0A852ZA34_9ACTN|nr:selenoneine biosynthesis selenosugar synthase SenB [Actinopolymorpha rutila]NYH89203.1 putative glycosyltransferase (TIGR04348 family) [Actinopolymorpha rutila]
MRICLVTPAPPCSYHGNRVTALRWADLLRGLGHSVQVTQTYDGTPIDLLIALHARKSADAVRQVRAQHPATPVVLALTGTDLYPDLESTGVDPGVLAAADRLVVLQSLGVEQIPEHLRGRARVIEQSAQPPPPENLPSDESHFTVAVLAHVRQVKDPLLVAEAVRLLPAGSRIQARHAGAVIEPELGTRAEEETRTNPRYTWLGELPPPDAQRLLARSRLLVCPSRHEGGANVVSEALAAGVPVVASRIPGTQGILGADYPGYFPVGDAEALAELLSRVERNREGFYDDLVRHCARLADLASPAREREAWAALLAELGGAATRG